VASASPERTRWPSFAFVRDAFAASPVALATQGDVKGTQGGDSTKRENQVRIIAHAFGIAEPAARPYVYIESIGSIGWALPVSVFAEQAYTLTFDVGNPAVTEKMFVGGQPNVVASPPRRIFITTVVDSVRGAPAPRLDKAALARISETVMAPGQVAKAQIIVLPSGTGTAMGGVPWWVWLVVIVVIILLFLFLRRRTA
jgi:hypothetical protein